MIRTHWIDLATLSVIPVRSADYSSPSTFAGTDGEQQFLASKSYIALAVRFKYIAIERAPAGLAKNTRTRNLMITIRLFSLDEFGDKTLIETCERKMPVQNYCSNDVCTYVPVKSDMFEVGRTYVVELSSNSGPETRECRISFLAPDYLPEEMVKVDEAGFHCEDGIERRDWCVRTVEPEDIDDYSWSSEEESEDEGSGEESEEDSSDSGCSDFDDLDLDFDFDDNKPSWRRLAFFRGMIRWNKEWPADPVMSMQFTYADGERREIVGVMSFSSYDLDENNEGKFYVSAVDPRPFGPVGPVYVELRFLDHTVAAFVSERLAPGQPEVAGVFRGEELRPADFYSPAVGARRILMRSSVESPATLEGDTFRSLQAMVGLEDVKSKIRKYVKLVHFHRLRAAEGISSKMPPLHALFMGAPGTGKTTVAELMGRLMHEAGVLSKGHVVTLERSQIVGRHYGDEAKAMRKALEEAAGGVLFIDEAYNLYKECDPKDPGREALETLLSALADPKRRDWMLILGGYEDKIMRLFEINPGLASRFPRSNYYRFADYSAKDLLEIADGFCRDNAYTLSPEAREHLYARLESDVKVKDEKFGNARHVLNLLETEILPAMAERVSEVEKPDSEALTVIRPEDIPSSVPVMTSGASPRPRVGFGV